MWPYAPVTDWPIDLSPVGGTAGGGIVCAGDRPGMEKEPPSSYDVTSRLSLEPLSKRCELVIPMTLSTHTLRQLGYAEGYLALGMKAQAAEALSQIAEAERAASPVLVLSLAVHTERGDWPNAAEVGAILCEREPGVHWHWIQWAYAVRRSKSLDAAKEILMRGVALHPQEAIFHFNLACYEAQLGRLDDARVLLETACALDGSYVDLAKTDADLAPLRCTN